MLWRPHPKRGEEVIDGISHDRDHNDIAVVLHVLFSKRLEPRKHLCKKKLQTHPMEFDSEARVTPVSMDSVKREEPWPLRTTRTKLI